MCKHGYPVCETQYYHASCYTGRGDFSLFRGWQYLKAKDKRRYGLPVEKKITTIKDLCPSSSNRWKIQARVTSKTEVRHWNNAGGSGCLFAIELIDSSGVDIRATFFRQAAVDKFYAFLHVGTV
jgi:replication factor A1